MKYLVVLAVLVLAGCSAGSVQQTLLVTCQSEAAAVSILADFKHAGKLSASQIALVDRDIALVDPVCSAVAPVTTLNGIVQTAATELITLAGSIK